MTVPLLQHWFIMKVSHTVNGYNLEIYVQGCKCGLHKRLLEAQEYLCNSYTQYCLICGLVLCNQQFHLYQI